MVKMLKTTLGWLKSVTLSGDWGRPFYLATMTGDHHYIYIPAYMYKCIMCVYCMYIYIYVHKIK